MAIGKRGVVNSGEEVEVGLGCVRYNRGLGRKRVLISNENKGFCYQSGLRTPVKRRFGEEKEREGLSLIESLPQELLVNVLCGVDHEDLEQLFNVSKTVRAAAEVAKQWHFAFKTPSKNMAAAFNGVIDVANEVAEVEIEAPNAPEQQRRTYRSRINGKALAGISVALFASPKKEESPRKGLFMDENA